MTVALLAGGILFALGLWWKAVGTAVIGAGVFTVCWIELMDEADASRFGARVRLLAQLPRLRLRLRRDLAAASVVLPLCRQYAERYPVYVRLPFILGECDEIRFAPSDAERKTSLSHSIVPGPVHDLAMIVSRRTHTVVDPLTLLLIINREVRRQHTETLLQAIWQERGHTSQTDFFAACLRFAVWERERSRCEGGCTLLYRDLFAESVLAHFTVQQLRMFCRMSRRTSVSRIIDKAVADAWNRSLQTKRAVRLEAALQNKLAADTDSVEQEQSLPGPFAKQGAAVLAQLAEIDLAAVTRRLEAVFATAGSAAEQHATARDKGYFVVVSAGKRVLFQVGTVLAGYVDAAVVAEAYTHAGLEYADRTVILALGPVHEDVLKDADQLGLLVLLWEDLDRLLAVHADRMWQAVEWSLRASRRTDAERSELLPNGTAANSENQSGVLELGLST